MRRNSLMERITRSKSFSRLEFLEYYPPFFFMGLKVVSVDPAFRSILIRLPLRWYGKNIHGTMFGGFLCAVSDPLPALLAAKRLPGVDVWTKSHTVEFIKPARGTVELRVEVKDEDITSIQERLAAGGKTTHTFEAFFTTHDGHQIAKVVNTVHFKRRHK